MVRLSLSTLSPLSTLSLGLLLACTLAACTPSAPLPLADLSLSLGTGRGAQATQPFAGKWSVAGKPAWLQVSPTSGQGDVNVQVSADRGVATPLTADQAALTGQITIEWSLPEGEAPRGTATWTVKADQYVLKGRLRDEATAQGQDLRTGTGPTAPQSGEGQARGIIVKYRDVDGAASVRGSGGVSERAGQTLRAAALSVTSSRPLSTDTAALQVGDVEAALRLLRADPRVEYAVPNALLHAQTLPQPPLAQPLEPTDQYAALQWPFRLLGYPAVWRDMEGGAYSRPVTVAVLDSGVRFDHPDLEGALWKPGEGALDLLTDSQNGDGNSTDDDPTDPGDQTRTTGSHGTHVTGIIAARWGQNTAQNTPSCVGCSLTGVVGAVRQANVKVLPIRVIDVAGDANIADVALAVRYAAGLPITLGGKTLTNPQQAAVINLSLGAPISADTARPMCEAVQDARDAGSLVIAAAGNGYGTVPYYPAACPAAVAVGSVTLSGGSAPKHAVYSSAYDSVQLSAPGGTDPLRDPGTFNGGVFNGQPFQDLVLSTGWDYARGQPGYEAQAGTSQAAPQVAALAALLLSKGVTNDPASTLARLNATATDLGATGRDPLFGSGMINAAAALGAPAISDTLGLRLQDSRGLVFQPPVDALGRFNAYLGEGSFTIVGGRDRDGNGIYGEVGEPRAEQSVTLGASLPQVDVGDLIPR